MARLSRWRISEVSRHRQRGRGLGQWVAPGGKTFAGSDQRLNQEGRQELALEPRLGAFRIGLFQMPHGEDCLQAPEGRFHLPAAAVHLEHRLGRAVLGRESGEHEDIAGRFEGLGLNHVPFAGVLALGALARECAGLAALFNWAII